MLSRATRSWRRKGRIILPPGIDIQRGKFRVRKRLGDGRRVVRSFDTLKEAEAFLALIEAGLHDARTVEASAASGVATVREVVDLWWLGPLVDGERGPEHRGGHRVRVSAVTARNYQYYIDAYISRIGDESAQAYARNTGLLKLFYDSLPNRCAWHVHGVLRMAFRDAVTRGLTERNPCDVTKPAKRKRRKRQIPSRPEVDKIVIASEERGDRWGLFVYLTSVLGTRCGETVALRDEDFDEPNKVVRIERAVSKTAGRPTIKEPKNGESRELPIDDAPFWDHVRPFLGGGGFLFEGFYRDGPRTGPGAQPKPWHPDHAEKRFKDTVRAIGMPNYTLHSLRHFVATQLLIEGQPLNQVAEFLGHSPSMTLMLYGRHLDRDAMRRVGRAATSLVAPPEPTPRPPREKADAIAPKPKAAPVDRDEADARIMALAADGPLTNAGIQRATGLTRRQASKALARLVTEHRLEKRGEKRGTHYVVPVECTGDCRRSASEQDGSVAH